LVFVLIFGPFKKTGVVLECASRFSFSGKGEIQMRYLVLICLLLTVGGCQTQSLVAIDDVMTPYVTLRGMIKSTMPQGVVQESENGRELTSGWFSPTNFYEPGESKAERVHAKVLILGSSRPFRVEIRCLKEKKSGNVKGKATYVELGEDVRLSKQLAQYFRDAMADRREDRSLIDDFRPF
jgi:hypothetical protein